MNQRIVCHSHVAILAVSTALLAGSSALAQPANDDCPNAIQVFHDGPDQGIYLGSSINSTNDGFSTDQFCAGSASDVWYKFVAPFNGVLIAHTCAAANFDTLLGIWNGCPQNGGFEIDCNNSGCPQQRSIEDVDITASQEYWIRVSGWEGESGTFTLTIIASESSGPTGPDVVLSNMTEIDHFGPVNDTHAYITDTHTCNIGNAGLNWGGTAPLWTWNAYRLAGGRLEQIGLSWVKAGVAAVPQQGCGMLCTGDGGPILGPGCRDIYNSNFNGDQGLFGPRSQVNAFSGAYPGPSGDCTVETPICKRLQIEQSDLDASTYPDALYFFEIVMVGADDAAAFNAMNNASYKRVAVNPDYTIDFASPILVGHPAIEAWRDHGMGLNTPDPDIGLGFADVFEDGRFHHAHRVKNVGNGQWRYEYAVFNLNSHRSARSFKIPVPSGVVVSNAGFHDVSYHSGEPFDGTDWSVTIDASGITWATQTFAQNVNANALRYGTMYTFWFDATTPPQPVSGEIGLFRPGPDELAIANVVGPSGPTAVCALTGDINVDSQRDGLDIAHFVNCALTASSPGGDCACADMDDSGGIDDFDVIQLINVLLGT